ncbi:MAG: nuclear transport factor 2 family protein [Solirubrobacteraceae bacterium]
MDDHAAIRCVVDAIDDAVDRKDWAACRALFADELHVDFSSLAGGEPGPLAADDLVGAWQANLHAAKASFHLRTNHRIAVEGDTATCVSKGYALNVMTRRTGDDQWEVWGWYEHTLRRAGDAWVCTGMTLDVVHARGNETVRTAGPDG